jgi:hypothetical protein
MPRLRTANILSSLFPLFSSVETPNPGEHLQNTPPEARSQMRPPSLGMQFPLSGTLFGQIPISGSRLGANRPMLSLGEPSEEAMQDTRYPFPLNLVLIRPNSGGWSSPRCCPRRDSFLRNARDPSQS